MRLKQYIRELSYIGNMGFEEMVQFFRIASKAEIEEMENAIKHDDWITFKKMIKKVVGVTLK